MRAEGRMLPRLMYRGREGVREGRARERERETEREQPACAYGQSDSESMSV